MPTFKTSEEWLKQSSLLLKARPSTTRITTKYNNPHPDKAAKILKRKRPTTEEETDASKADSSPKATLTLKTFDPISGVVLKYETDKAAEIGRLIASLGTLGREMAALPEIAQEALAAKEGTGTNTPVPETIVKSTPTDTKGPQGTGNKKKKKGKK
ncbi:hypothetical protein EJ08DRAFT_269114 [Tothia fuscella]|uniref:SRP9 domain-containing protein n=1 Tax=Tothia fuscella TaxID=1048955 RepID=A0A9P4TYE1_9PEZI|nr:hypothetical protein EJ08DRAFT_269114 [Tothia fuscella]